MATVIRVEHVSKRYRLGVISYGMLYKDFQSWLARRRNRPDPHASIDSSEVDSKEYIWALKDVCLDIVQGDRVGIIGRNGAGKSTLLKVLSRITFPTTGKVRVKGRIASLLEIGTGFHQELTGKENIFLNGAILGMKQREISRKLDEILAFAEIENFADTPVKRYSSGMYVRLAFSVAAHLDSEILLADEVLAVGDVAFQNKCLLKMQDLSVQEGRTIVYVSHNMGTLQALCNVGVLLKSGEMVYHGTVSATIDKYLESSNVDHGHTPISFMSSCNRFSLNIPYWINSKGERVSRYAFGENIILRFKFEFFQTVGKINPGFAVINRLGQRIFTSHMADDFLYVNHGTYNGSVVIDTELGLNSLAPGHYVVSFGVRDESENTVIYSSDDLTLEITESGVIKNGANGILWHTSKWIEREERK